MIKTKKYTSKFIIFLITVILSCTSSTEEDVILDNSPPIISGLKINAFRFNANIEFQINDYFSEKIFVDIYLDSDLITSIEKDIGNDNIMEHTIINLEENSSYSLEIIVTDESNNASTPISTNFSTNGSVFKGNLEFKTQTEVDEFGMFQYEVINGNLEIEIGCLCDDKISNLTSLNDLRIVNGNTSISSQSLLFSEPFNGLSNIERIDGSLYIGLMNPSSLLINLTTLGGNLTLYNLSQNEEPLLPNLIRTKGLTISDLINIENFKGLNSLKIIDGSLIISSSKIQNLDFLQSLTIVNSFMYIELNDKLVNLNGFQSLSTVSGNISISVNDSLSDFCGLTNLINNDFNNDWVVNNNAYNPSITDIELENCSL